MIVSPLWNCGRASQPRCGYDSIGVQPRYAEYGNQVPWDATPLGLCLNNDGSLLRCSTQGSRVRQPWAGGCNPVGVAATPFGVATESTTAPLLHCTTTAPLLHCTTP